MQTVRIGKAAERLGCHCDTLRRAERRGAFLFRRTLGGHRIVTDGDLARLAMLLGKTRKVQRFMEA